MGGPWEAAIVLLVVVGAVVHDLIGLRRWRLHQESLSRLARDARRNIVIDDQGRGGSGTRIIVWNAPDDTRPVSPGTADRAAE